MEHGQGSAPRRQVARRANQIAAENQQAANHGKERK